MKITKELLKEKGACADGYRDFLKEYPVDEYPDGVEYQELLDCCAEKNFSYGSWLLGAFGKTDEVRKIDGDLIGEKGIIFAGQLEVKGCIEAGDGIEAGYGIKAGWGIEAGCGIKAGEDIEAGRGIKAGCGIEAGAFISVKKRIFAGISIYRTSKDCDKTIRCTELRDGEVCYGDLILTGSEEKPDED